MTWAAHSSVAVVLVVMSLGAAHLVSPTAVLAMVLGANLGSALNPLIETSQPGNPASRRLPIGNLLTRVVGCALVLPFLHADLRSCCSASSRTRRASPRTFTPPSTCCSRSCSSARWISWPPGSRAGCPSSRRAPIPVRRCISTRRATGAPAVALVCAAREVLRMGDVIETMLRQAMTALLTNDRKLVAEISRMDDAVDSLNEAVKLYVTRMTRDSLDDRDGYRAMEIISFSINLEHVGDIIDKNLMDLASKKIRRGITFSKEGEADLVEFHQQVVDSLRLSVGIFMSGDIERRTAADRRKSAAAGAGIRGSPSAISRACAKGRRIRSSRIRSIWTSCAISSGFIRIFVRPRIPFSSARARCSAAASRIPCSAGARRRQTAYPANP